MAQDDECSERYQRELAEDRAEWTDFNRTGKALSQSEVRAYFEEKIRRRVQQNRQKRQKR